MKLDIKKFFTGVIDWGKQHKSDLKMWTGTIGVAGGTGLLCKETVKVSEMLKEYREAKQELIKDEAEAKDIRKLKAQTAGKVALTVLPGVVVEGSGLGLMWSGYSDVKAAFIGVGIAYGELQGFINDYRQGVKDKYGEEVDEELAYHFRTEEVVINENGEERVETIRIYPHDRSHMPSPYARYFVYGEAEGAERSFEYNERFLELQQDVARRFFRAHKKFMLNDLYDMLGFKRSKAGNHVGWIYDPNDPEGDNQIDFRIQVVYREKLDELGNSNGWEKVLMIDPNVDGMVEDKMVRMGLIDE